MSVSKHILEEAHIALLDNGQMALVDYTKKGVLRVHRYISRAEVLNIIRAFFIQYRHEHPDKEVMQLPFTEDTILAIAALPMPKDER